MATTDSNTKNNLDPTVDFVAGTVAGIAGIAVGHPFDTVKVRFQSPQIFMRYKSTFHALTTIIREERFIGLYKGISSPLASCALLNGLIFASYHFFAKVQLGNDNKIPTISQITLAGVGSGIVSSIVTTPTELIKIHQQSLLTSSNPWTIVRQIIKESGVRGLYRGLTATALRDCGYGAYFGAYELSCRCFASYPTLIDNNSSIWSMEQEAQSLSWPALLISGGIAGVAGWVATFPFDVVKTRIQGSQWSSLPSVRGPLVTAQTVAQSTTDSSLLAHASLRNMNPYRTTVTTIIHSFHAEGVSVFYRGLAPTLIRAIPVNMVTFATFQAAVQVLS